MDSRFIILAFCLVGPIYCKNLSFIHTTNGTGEGKCSPDSICVVNITNHPDHNGNSCSTGGSFNNVSYVCLKNEFLKSNCTKLTNRLEISKSGCYVYKGGNKISFFSKSDPDTHLHLFSLHRSLRQYSRVIKQWIPEFGYCNCEHNTWIEVKNNSWILVKFSDSDSGEDLGEFFMDNPEPPVKEEGKESEKKQTSAWIIWGSVGLVLLIVFVLVAFVFYRRNLQNAKSSRNIEPISKSESEFPLEGNKTMTNTTRDQEFDDQTIYNDLYETTQSEVQFHVSESPLEGNKTMTKTTRDQEFNDQTIYNDLYETTQSEVQFHVSESPLEGNKTMTKTTRDQEFNDQAVYSDLYETTQSEVQFQLKAQVHSENQGSAQLSEDVYAEVNKKKDIKTCSTPGGPSHVVVHGDLYATVNKEGEGPLDVNFCHPDDLVREEVNGEIYTTVQR